MELRTTNAGLGFRWPAVLFIATVVAAAPGLSACGGADDELPPPNEYGIEGTFEPGDPLGKADSAQVPGPWVNTDTRATQVWTARNKWEDTDTAAAQAAGIAWDANSGLDWNQKFQRWLESMPRQGSTSYYDTFTLTTPWGKTVPAPKLECAEVAYFLRIAFASWYELPFFVTATDSQGTRVYFGHFGARTKNARYKNTPKYGYWYKDYSDRSAEQVLANWPRDEKLRGKGLYGGGDDMDFIAPGAKAGAYFDEVFLNKRVGHFLLLSLAYFGSMHLADARNAYNLKPEAIQEGDILIERWQRRGIGHVLNIKQVDEIGGGQLSAELMSGSMPRRQPAWESPTASKHYFTLAETGGEGTNRDGDEYVKLGGGIKRWRVTKNIGGYWTNTWMGADEASWISDSDWDALKARPGRFETLLGQADPAVMRDALLQMIEDKRNHLRQYPASCSARTGREEAFHELYELMAEEFNMSAAEVDANYRILEDYVFAELEYTESKTCCWNSSTAAMHQIVMDYNQSQMEDGCVAPTIFMNDNGYGAFEQYAEQTGRGHLWKPWAADESCPQQNVASDTPKESQAVPWCEIADGGGQEQPSGCSDDGYEPNDQPTEANGMNGGNHSGLMVCSGNDDYYSFTASSSLTVAIDFDHSEGDLDLAVYQGADQVGQSQGTTDHEEVSVSGGGTYTVRVYGYQGAEAGYALSATVN